MSAEEKRQILKMVEEGRISAAEAMTLIKALEEGAEGVGIDSPGRPPALGESRAESTGSAPEFEEVKSRARRFAMIPLWLGVGMTVLFAWLMYASYQNSGFGFWFSCLTVPFLVGVLIIALMAGSMSSRWLFVDVRQRPGQSPQRITLGFPIPLRLVAWGMRNFGSRMPGMDSAQAETVAELIKTTSSSSAPLIVNAQDDEDGERVMVYIG